jgi:hypothetical protein
MDNYPQHARLKEVQPISQALHEFVLEFLGSKRMGIGQYVREGSDTIIWARDSKKLIAEFLEIDLDQLEKEKLNMLEMIRKANETKHGNPHAQSL